MNWTELLDYLTHPQSEMTIWVLIAIPVLVIGLNYVVPQILQWRDYRRVHPYSAKTSKAQKKAKR